MSLFRCLDARPEAVHNPAVLQTPLGRVQLEATFGGMKISDEATTATYQLPPGGWLACWYRQDCDLELLVCRPLFESATDMPPTDCWAGLWRLRAKAKIPSCTLTAIWEDGHTWTEGGPNSRQWEYIKTWDDGQTEVSIATDDDDFLAVRSRRGDGLPTAWEPYFGSTMSHFSWFSLQTIHFEVGDMGLAIPLPPLEAGQECQIHFALAWSPEGPEDASGFAVSMAASEILAGAGCS